MNAVWIACPVVEFLKGGKLFLQWYIGQITGLADDLHVMLQLLKMEELQNPLTGLNFQGTGRLTTPLGANLLRTSALPAKTAIGLDRRFALEMVRSGEVAVEYDKLIDRQLERAAITTISGFAKVFPQASRVLEI